MLESQLLIKALTPITQEDYPVHSRIHQLKIGSEYGVLCWVKREDELGCLLSGSKARKYRSLVAALKKRGCKKAGLIGSQFSNHILGLSSLLIENGIEPTLFLLKAQEAPKVGNSLFIQLFVPEQNILYIERENWHKAHEIALSWQMQNSNFQAEVIPEGGSIADSVTGLATLAVDIIQNEMDHKLTFSNILIDSGSGLTAATLIAAFGLIKKEVHIHVMLAASNQEEFSNTLSQVKQALESSVGAIITKMPQYTLHAPPTAKSFGSTNATIFQTIVQAAHTEGFLLDPLYSSKLYLLLKHLLQSKSLAGPTLFIHSGGLFSLSGFQPQLQKFYDEN
jgi:1-aminocyclopropane-1-carboxylate deaminase